GCTRRVRFRTVALRPPAACRTNLPEPDEDDPMTSFLLAHSSVARPFVARVRVARGFALLLGAALALAGCSAGTASPDPGAQAEAVAAPALIPLPASLEPREGSFRFDRGTQVSAEGEAAGRVASHFAGLVATTHGFTPNVADDAAQGGIAFAIDPAVSADAPEGYVLEVTGDGVRVAASDERGLFHGATTLWQLLSSAPGEAVRIPALRIEDAPRFAWRGLMLDSARHFQSVDEIKRLIDAMARHKLNVLHW